MRRIYSLENQGDLGKHQSTSERRNKQLCCFYPSVRSDGSRQGSRLSNHIPPYQCPSLVQLRQTLDRRNSELAFLRGNNIY